MKTLRIDLPEDFDEIKIYPLADLHIGDKQCDMKSTIKLIDKIKNDDKAFVILNGDLINNATRNSVSDVYGEVLNPTQQYEKCVELLGPIKDKILCITSGNHERRTYKDSGIDICKLLADKFDLADRYGVEGVMLFLRFGWNKSRKRKQWYSIYTTHGSGGGRKEGAKVNRLGDMASIVDADIYVHSHTHLPVTMKKSFFRSDSSNSTVTCVDKLFVNTASQLTYGAYGQIGEYSPSSNENPIIVLSGTDKKFNSIL